MNTNTTGRFARYFALPVISAGIIGGAALGFAGAASAATYSQPSIVATPSVKAHPAPNALPGTHHHNRIAHIMNLEPSYHP